MTTLLEVKDLTKLFPITKGIIFKKVLAQVHAVEDVNFSIQEGETFSLVGESGSGKTTIGKLVLGSLKPTFGKVLFEEQDLTTLTKKEMKIARKKMGIIFQDPFSSLNPRKNAESIISEPILIHKELNTHERVQKVQELISEVGLGPEHLSRYPHEFSGGQLQRIAIARSLALNPKFIVADEPTSALDVSVQAQILNLLKELQKKFGLSYLFITHDLSVVQHIADDIEVMYLGRFVEGGSIDEVFYNPIHPYSRALLSARPTFDPSSKQNRIILEGDVPSPVNPPSGCTFHPRCQERDDHVGCGINNPRKIALSGTHYMMCLPFKKESKSYRGMEFISD